MEKNSRLLKWGLLAILIPTTGHAAGDARFQECVLKTSKEVHAELIQQGICKNLGDCRSRDTFTIAGYSKEIFAKLRLIEKSEQAISSVSKIIVTNHISCALDQSHLEVYVVGQKAIENSPFFRYSEGPQMSISLKGIP